MAYNPEEDIKVSDLPEKTTNVVSDDKLLVIDSEDANILKQVDASKVWWWWSGTWDMLKSVYDKNNDWVVDDAEALWWFPASDYAKSADVQPTLESGVNIKTINWNSILWPWNIEIQGWWTVTVDDTLSTTSENPVQNKVINNALNGKQDTLVSGTNIKTINNTSILGSGNIEIQGGGWSWAQQPIASINKTTQVETIFQIYSKKWAIQPRFVKVDYQVREYYPLTNPTREKVHYWIWLLSMEYENEETSTNPSNWEFSCVYDWKQYNDCFVYLWYDENNRQGWWWYIKRVPSSIDTNTKQVTCTRVEWWNTSSSYWKEAAYYMTKIA